MTEQRPGKVCTKCSEHRQAHLYAKLAPGKYGDVCRPCRLTATGNRPSGRICAACEVRKTVASFRRVSSGVYFDLCRVCEKRGEVFVPRPPKTKRLCIACGVERGRDCFERRDGVTAECCDLCTSGDGRITLKQLDAATVAVRVLRQVATARLDAVPGFPTLGVDGLRALAQEALAKIEAAR